MKENRFYSLFSILQVLSSFLLVGCFTLPQNPNYKGPKPISAETEAYYKQEGGYFVHKERLMKEDREFSVQRYSIDTKFGPITIDYFHRNEPSDDLILVFPVLGGKNHLENYFASYFARNGFDAAIVHRNNDFKDPNNIDHLEEILRAGIIRDRLALDFFENELKKKNFGTFGISRGAINVAATAGVDKRLKFNVLAMGGTDIVSIFRKSDAKKLRFFTQSVVAKKGITEEQFYEGLQKNLKTDPKYLASSIDSRNTMMFLSMFDSTVPFTYGRKLLHQIGDPETNYVLAGHKTSILYTQYIHLLSPSPDLCIFPIDYIEQKSLEFYREKFHNESSLLSYLPLKIIQLPLNILAGFADALF